MGKEKSFGEKLSETVDRLNRRQAKNYAMYSAECHRQSRNVGEPIDIMAMLENKKRTRSTRTSGLSPANSARKGNLSEPRPPCV